MKDWGDLRSEGVQKLRFDRLELAAGKLYGRIARIAKRASEDDLLGFHVERDAAHGHCGNRDRLNDGDGLFDHDLSGQLDVDRLYQTRPSLPA